MYISVSMIKKWWFSIVMLVFGRIWHGKKNGLTWIVHVSSLIHLNRWITSCCSISTLSLKPTLSWLFLKINLVNLHPSKLTCPLQRDYFSREYIFQPLIFRGHVSFQGGIFFWHLQTVWTSRFYRHISWFDGRSCVAHHNHITMTTRYRFLFTLKFTKVFLTYIIALLKTIMKLQIWWFVDVYPFPTRYFQVPRANFQVPCKFSGV